MKSLSLLVAAAVVAPAVAAADPGVSYDDARLAGQTLVKVLDAGKASAVRGAFTPGMTIENLAFTDAKCDKAFGRHQTRTIAKKQFAKLASCLLAADWRPTGDVEITAGDDGFVIFGDDLGGGPYLAVVFGRSKDGVPRITRIEAHDGAGVGGTEGAQQDDAVQPTTVTRVVHDDVVPAPPPPSPQVVAPTQLEAVRLTGDPRIAPDDDTKVAIERAGKTKVVASFKLCASTTGAVYSVTMLKSSGFPVYDAQLEAGIRTWTYRPFAVNGKVVPVCTAVTFVYSQK